MSRWEENFKKVRKDWETLKEKSDELTQMELTDENLLIEKARFLQITEYIDSLLHAVTPSLFPENSTSQLSVGCQDCRGYL